MQHGAPTPYMFLIQSMENDSKVYAAQPEFDAFQDTIQLPKEMYHSLGCTSNSTLKVTTTQLPRGKSVTFKPLTMEWENLTFNEQTALLEMELRHRQILTQDEIFELFYCDMVLKFQVSKLTPEKVVNIAGDTDLETNIEKVNSKDVNRTIEKGTYVYRKGQLFRVKKVDDSIDPIALSLENIHTGAEVGTEIPFVTLEHPILSTRIDNIQMDNKTDEKSIEFDKLQYYRFEVDKKINGFELSVKGGPDVYLIHSEMSSSSRWPLPGEEIYIWKDESYGDTRKIKVTTSDPKF
eukprot:UN27662